MVKIIIAGDFAPMYRVANLINDERYSDIFDEIVQYTSLADYSIVNLESPVVNLDTVRPIEKYGPNLKCTSKAVNAIKYAGFDMITLANNHIYDYGDIGVQDTIDKCKSEEVDYVGVGRNLEDASRTFYKTIKGKRFAFINCCENEFSIATPESYGAHPLNPVMQFYQIREARQHADKVIVIVHGGHEHYNLPSTRMKETYRFFVDSGADVVINHHQHCFSGYELYKGSMIFYGLGNFCFDISPCRVNHSWNLGYMVELSFDTTLTYKIIPYSQCGEIPKVEILPLSAFDYKLQELNSIILNDDLLNAKTEEYYNSHQSWECSILEPYGGRVTRKLFSMGLLPKFVKGAKISQILNHVECESHRDKLIYALRKRLK